MFKKIKSLFIIEEESSGSTSKNTPESKAKPDESQTSEAGQDYERPVFDDANPPGEPDEKFVNRLLKAIEDNNIEGFDYLEYKQALQNLANVDMDEQTKYTSALAVARTMGANKVDLIKSGNHYLDVLEKEEKKFLEAFKHQFDKQVNGRTKEIEVLEKTIKTKEDQIKQLQDAIEQDRKKLEKNKKGIDKAREKVENTRKGFYSAYHIVAEQIKDDITKIKDFLD